MKRRKMAVLRLSIVLMLSLIIVCAIVQVKVQSAEEEELTAVESNDNSEEVVVGDDSNQETKLGSTKRLSKRHESRYSNLLAPTQQRRTTAQQQPPEQPPGELLFSNNTGAVAQCGIALELARSIAHTESTNSVAGKELNKQSAGQTATISTPDIQVRWLKENGEEVEQVLYADPQQIFVADSSSASDQQQQQQSQQQRPLRFVRSSDGALVFEPFRAADFRPDVHATIYRCVAVSSSRGASLISRDMRVRAVLNLAAANQLEVLDEMVLEGNSATFRCQVASFALEYLQVVDWIEYPSETVLSFQSTTQHYAQNHLFPSSSSGHNLHRRTELLAANNNGNNSSNLNNNNNNVRNAATQMSSRYLVAPKSGNLHVINVDLSLTGREFRCRAKNRLTGELLTSVNKGKLVVTDANSPLAPRLTIEAANLASSGMLQSGPFVYEEGELAMLTCELQAFSRLQLSWFRLKTPAAQTVADQQQQHSDLEPIEIGANGVNLSTGYAQLGNLLLINRAQRNHSGRYLCVASNSRGEERLEMELQVRAPLRVKLTASGHVLELGKSLALECSVTGFPIHQVVFKHNQNVIKSISGAAASAVSQSAQLGSYFVVDSSVTSPEATEVTGSGANNELVSSLSSSGSHLSSSNNNNHLSPADEQTNQIKLSHVIVIVLEPQHAGAYQCFAHNQYESVQTSAYIRVLDDPPKFKETFKSQVFEQRQEISLQCSARANPLPEITWSVDEQPIGESAGRARFGDFVTKDNLVISYVNISQTQVADSGLYRCTADNGLAQVSHQAQISVMGPLQVKPMIRSTVLASTTFRIRCPVAGHPIQEVQWFHSNRRLPTNHRQHVYENGTLEVEHMERSAGDDGEYTCQATSGQAGEPPAQGSIQVSIKARPTIEPFTISRSLREGQRASIMCTISSGDLPIAISWFRNEQPLVESSVDGQVYALSATGSGSLLAPQVFAAGTTTSTQHWQQSPEVDSKAHNGSSSPSSSSSSLLANVRISRVSDYSSTLLFESLLVHHSANYTCLARNEAGSMAHTAHMVVQVAPKWTIEPTDTNVVRGASLSIDCMASGFPLPRVIWTKALAVEANGAQLGLREKAQLGQWRSIVSSPHLQVHENGSLNVLDARDSDFGHYMCQAANGVGPGLSKVIKVTVNVAAQFNMRHSLQYVSKGEQTHLKCQAKGDWPMAVHWFKNKSRLEPIISSTSTTNSQQSATSGEMLVSSAASSSDAALPQPPGSATLAHLQLQALRSGNSVMEQLAELLSTTSSSSSNNKQLQRYLLSNTEIPLNNRQQLLVDSQTNKVSPSAASNQPPLVVQLTSVLSIDRAERQDTSTFRCISVNNYGLDERIIQLIVQEPPERIDELSILETSSRSIALAWMAPHDGNAPITHYHVHYRAASGYHAHSGGSDGSAEWLNVTLTAAPETQQQQLQSTAVAVAVASGTLPKVGVVDGGPSAGASTVGSGRTLVKVAINALKPITHYWFSVEAENKLGRGQRSPVVESRTVEEAPGAAPGKLKAQAQSSSSIKVSWSRLQDKELFFGPVQGYYVAYKPLSDSPSSSSTSPSPVVVPLSQVTQMASASAATGNNNSEVEVLTQSAATNAANQHNNALNTYKTVQHEEQLNKFEALLTGLRRSTRYMITVQAFNARGSGPASEPIVERTLDLDPPKQVKLFVKQTSNCSIQLEWRPLSQSALMQNNKQGLLSADEQIKSDSVHLPTALPFHHQSLSEPYLSASRLSVPAANHHLMSTADQVDYYSLYQAELGDERPQWREHRLQGSASSFTVEGLRCGAHYRFYMIASNRIGSSEQSDLFEAKTSGGLPIAPDRRSTFDVINTTCYLIRLDHWLDNGCPIREFYVRYRHSLDSSSSSSSSTGSSQSNKADGWIQLAHLNLSEVSSLQQQHQPSPTRNLYSNGDDAFVKHNQLWPSRVRRSALSQQDNDNDDTYLFNGGGPPEDSEEDSFFDYLPVDGSLASGSAGDLNDYAQAEPFVNLSSLSAVSQLPELSNNNNRQPEQSSQLINLLKDSMLPAFEADELEQSQLERLSPVNAWQSQATPSTGSFVEQLQVAAGKEGSPSPTAVQQVVLSSALPANQRASSEQVVSQQQHESRTAQATRVAVPLQDWRKVRLCNLLENTYYTVQVTASNSVGETDAELRLLTSQEGLEYDAEIKRQVVGKLGGNSNRMAQLEHSMALGESFNLFTTPLNNWPLLLPVTLLITLLTVMLVIVLLIRRNSAHNAPGSTSTTTTTTSSSSSSSSGGSSSNQLCQSYLNGTLQHPPHHQQHRSSTTTTATAANNYRTLPTQMSNNGSSALDSYTLASQHNLIDNHYGTNSNNLAAIYQHQLSSNQSVFEEPSYGLLGLNNNNNNNNNNRLTNTAQTANDMANRSSSSPATTAIGSSINSSSSTSGNVGHNNTAAVYQDNLMRSSLRNPAAYLCKEEPRAAGEMFYAMTGSPLEANSIYATQQQQQQQQTVQLRHFQQQEDAAAAAVGAELANSKESAVTSYLASNPLQHQQNKQQQQLFQQSSNGLYESASVVHHNNNNNNHPHHQAEGSGSSITSASKQQLVDSSCFLNIVEEVARANESLSQQRLLQSVNNSSSNKTDQHELEQDIVTAAGQQCNQIDCYSHHLVQAATAAAASGSMSYSSPGGRQVVEQLHHHHHHQDENPHFQDNQMQNSRLMFDPVYATIRRTFPQAFKYLTLQQHHHQNQSEQPNQQLICNQNPTSVQNQLEKLQLQQQTNLANDVGSNIFTNTTNLAALNLQTSNLQQQQQQHQSNIDSSLQ